MLFLEPPRANKFAHATLTQPEFLAVTKH